MGVSTIASHPVAVANRGDSLARALQQMWLLRCEHLPVVESREGILLGILSLRDLLIHANDNGYAAHELRHVDPKQVFGSTRVDEIMKTSLVTIGPDESLSSAARSMLRNKIHALPLTQHGALVGIVTETDLLRSYTDPLPHRRPKEADDEIGDHMATNVFTVKADELPPTIVRIMRDKHVRHAPVVDSDQQLVGILSEGDMLWGHNVAKADYDIQLPKRWQDDVRESEVAADAVVAHPVCAADLMNDQPCTLGVCATLADAANLMVVKSFGSVPMVEDRKLVGIVTSSDLLRLL